MRAYSIDLRERIVRAVEAGHPKAVVARTFGVGLATVKRYVAQQQATGSLVPKQHLGPQPRLGPADAPALRAQLEAAPDATLAEHCQRWAESQRVAVSVPTMHRAIARLGWTRKKRR